MKEQEWPCLAGKRGSKSDSGCEQVGQKAQEWSEEILLLFFTITFLTFSLPKET